MKQVSFKLPTIDKVTFELSADYDDTPIRGNAIVSGDDDYDKEVEDELIERSENGDIWAWALVTVTAKYKGIEANTYLGGCSYKDEEDFKKDGYFEDMKKEVFADLLRELENLND